MEWASPYVYEGHSEEEEVSEGELEEGMWLSDSDDDEVPPPPPPPRTERRAGFLGRLFKRAQTGRKSGAPPPPDDDDSSGEEDSEDEDEQRKGLPRVSGYADLSFPAPPLRQESDDSQLSSPLPSMASSIDTSGVNADVDREKDRTEMEVSPGKYAQLAEFQQEMKDKNTSDKIPTAPDVLVQPPNNQPGEAAVPSPPPPPPPTAPIKQLRGIMRGELKKQKRQRVRWDKSYKNKHRDGSSQGIRTRRPDTNILIVKFNTLRETGHLHTGDAQFCSNPECGSIVSHLTKLVGEEDDEKKLWTCEFCGTTTELEIVPEEIPTEEDTTYLITPAGVIAEEGGSVGGAGTDESLVVFCIDTSGSMCVTTEVPGRYDLRGAKEKHEKLLQSLPTDVAADLRQPEYRFMQGNSRNVTHISRMESLQAAIDSQLARLAHSEPNKRACLVTFSDDVTIIGDGRMTPVTVAGDKLSDSKAIIDVGRAISLPATIRETQRALSKKVFSLEESGQTALGPAVLVSVVVASQKPGSKVVICTDGLANVGLGSLDVVASNDKSYAAAENFYEDLGDIAMDKGVTVSLLSIEGSDCRVVELGQVANRTGGQVTMVNPLTVTEEFGSILNNPVIATDVVSKIIVHHDMYFRNEDTKDSVIIKQVGNVTADSELTYEYGVQSSKKTTKNDKTLASEQEGGDVKSKAQTGATAGASPLVEKDVPPQMVDGQPHLPFQLQIEYTNSDGDRCLRVITKTKPVTQDRKLAEKEMDAGIIGSHVAKQAAELTMQGEFTKARVKSIATQKLLQEHSRTSASRRWEYTNYCANMIPLENELHEMQINESSRGRNYSDEEYEEDFYERGSELMGTSFSAPKLQKSSITPQQHIPHYTQSAPMAPSRPHVRKSKEAHRRREMPDNLAYGLYGLKTASSDAFRSPSSQVQQRAATVADLPPRPKRGERPKLPKPSSQVQQRSVTIADLPPRPKPEEAPTTIPSPVDQEPKTQQEPPK